MGLFENNPYTNYHDLNTDWIISKIGDVNNARDAAIAAAEDAASFTGNATATVQTRGGNSATSIQTAEIPDGIYFVLVFAHGGSITGWLHDLYYMEVISGGAVLRPIINDDVIDASLSINAGNIIVMNNYATTSEQVKLLAIGSTRGY